MKQTKRVTEITQSLNALKQTDIYSLMLFALYKLRDDPKYVTLSELALTLDGSNLTKLLGAFGGLTIKIPTLRDLRLMTQALLLYQYIQVEEKDFSTAIKIVAGDEFKPEEIKEAYQNLMSVLQQYNFGGELAHAGK